MTTMMQPRNLPGGRRAWLDGSVAEFVDHLTALDDRLALVQTDDGRWEIWRCAEDGSEHIVCRSPQGARLGPEVIQRLAANDSRRTDVVERMIRQNDQAEKDRVAALEEQMDNAFDSLMRRTWRGRIASNIEDLSL